MPFVIAAVVLVGAVAALNLTLTLAVVRRLRQLQGDLEVLQSLNPAFGPEPGFPVGGLVPAFAATSTDGRPVARDAAGPMVFGFFSVECQTCWKRLPAFLDYVAQSGLGPDQVVATVVGDGGQVAEDVRRLEGVGRVVVENVGGIVSETFMVKNYPSYVLVDANGMVEASTYSSDELPQTVGA